MKCLIKTVRLVLISLVGPAAGLLAEVSEFKIIANKGVSIERLSLSQVRRYFHAELSTWPDGTPLTIVTFSSGTSEEKKFVKKVLKKTSPQMKKHYLKKVFAGDLSEVPIEAEDIEEVIEIVKDQKGAIGYVPTSTTIPESVKVISITRSRKKKAK